MCLHLTMTLLHCEPVHRPASKGSTHSGQLTRTRLAGRSPLQQTANDKLGTWQGHWDSMCVYTHDTQSSLDSMCVYTHDTQSSLSAWTCNFWVMLSDNVSLAPGPARPAVKHDIHQWTRMFWFLRKLEEIRTTLISSNFCLISDF